MMNELKSSDELTGEIITVISYFIFFFKQKTAYEMRISDWSSDVCSCDLRPTPGAGIGCGITGAPVSARRVFNDLRLPGERKNASLVADANRDGRVERPTKQGSSVGFRAFAIWTLAGTSLLEFPAHAQITPADRKRTRLNSSHKCAHSM